MIAKIITYMLHTPLPSNVKPQFSDVLLEQYSQSNTNVARLNAMMKSNHGHVVLLKKKKEKDFCSFDC